MPAPTFGDVFDCTFVRNSPIGLVYRCDAHPGYELFLYCQTPDYHIFDMLSQVAPNGIATLKVSAAGATGGGGEQWAFVSHKDYSFRSRTEPS